MNHIKTLFNVRLCHRCYQQIDVHLYHDIEMQDEMMVAKAGEPLHYRAICYRTIARPTCARCRHRIKAMERLIRMRQKQGWDIEYNTMQRDYKPYELARAPLLGKRVRILPLSDGSPSGLCGLATTYMGFGSFDGPFIKYSVEIEDMTYSRNAPLIRQFLPEQLAEL